MSQNILLSTREAVRGRSRWMPSSSLTKEPTSGGMRTQAPGTNGIELQVTMSVQVERDTDSGSVAALDDPEKGVKHDTLTGSY
jgi:hypothetical protein